MGVSKPGGVPDGVAPPGWGAAWAGGKRGGGAGVRPRMSSSAVAATTRVPATGRQGGRVFLTLDAGLVHCCECTPLSFGSGRRFLPLGGRAHADATATARGGLFYACRATAHPAAHRWRRRACRSDGGEARRALPRMARRRRQGSPTASSGADSDARAAGRGWQARACHAATDTYAL